MNFTIIKQKLDCIRNDCISSLRAKKSEAALEEKKAIDALISLVRWAELYDIQPNSTVIRLPNSLIQSPSSAFRIIDDNETENRQNWTDLTRTSEAFFLQPGDILIKNIPHSD
ncbi:MAG: hypothetical protein IPK50_09475 [Fibrobacterota bacterium]|nr:MAG: hypothetical protein IPK50_09475 [Fibrobacterota bacterium]